MEISKALPRGKKKGPQTSAEPSLKGGRNDAVGEKKPELASKVAYRFAKVG